MARKRSPPATSPETFVDDPFVDDPLVDDVRADPVVHELRAWWAQPETRRKALCALALVSGLSRAKMLRRLDLPNRVDRLAIPTTDAERIQARAAQRNSNESQRRPRGRPAREIDEQRVARALRVAKGSIRAAALRLKIPRSTLGRFVAAQEIPTNLHLYPAALRLEHAQLLANSGVAPDVAIARRYESMPSGLRIPIYSADGARLWLQIRRDKPARRRDRYRNAHGPRPVIDVPPAGRDFALTRTRRLYVTESPRKADTAVSHGLACVDVVGVELLCTDPAEWSRFDVMGREIVIAFDADVATNARVALAERKLRDVLSGLGAHVTVLRLPPLPGHPKAGIDDHLMAGASERDLLRMAALLTGA